MIQLCLKKIQSQQFCRNQNCSNQHFQGSTVNASLPISQSVIHQELKHSRAKAECDKFNYSAVIQKVFFYYYYDRLVSLIYHRRVLNDYGMKSLIQLLRLRHK